MTAEQLKQLETNLWQAADKLRVDSGLKASEYATPILGLKLLRLWLIMIIPAALVININYFRNWIIGCGKLVITLKLATPF